MKTTLSIIILFCSTLITSAQKVSGVVVDSSKQPLAFSSIVVKGTSIGTSANKNGFYSLPLDAGTYHIICQHVGYKSQEKTVTIGTSDVELNFELKEQQY